MKHSLLFIPDISGFTKFVQSTEIEHSQHVIAELLEILINANADEFQLAEIEGDALFFYKEGEIPSLEQLLAKVEQMFVAFYSHLKVFETHRICPCNACATAPNLDLKIIAHSGELQFISVLDHKKPFGTKVIEVHRLLKNSIGSKNYLLLSKGLTEDLGLPENFDSPIFDFKDGTDTYDGGDLNYQFAVIDKNGLTLEAYARTDHISFDKPPAFSVQSQFSIPAAQLYEYISNFKYRHLLVEGDHTFEYNEQEVNKIGSKHVCVVDGVHIDFVTVTKAAAPGQLVYGELTTTPPIVDALYSFSIITPLSKNSCTLDTQIYWIARSPIKKLAIALFAKKQLKKNMLTSVAKLQAFIQSTLE